MAFTAIAAVAAVGTVYGAVEQRNAAKQQAAATADAARQASLQAAESARGNALAAQAATERQQAEATAAANDKAAVLDTTKPDVEISAVDPTEVARRRTVRATFGTDGQVGAGSIRL